MQQRGYYYFLINGLGLVIFLLNHYTFNHRIDFSAIALTTTRKVAFDGTVFKV
jgi:hypothetical protein